MLFPPPWFPPRGPPPSEAPPSKKEIPRGRKPIPASPPLKRGGHSTALVGFMVAALHSERVPDAVEYDGPGNTFTAWVGSTTLPLHQSPQPPRESRHTGRTTCSLLCTWLPALGGKVGQQPARSSHGGRLSAECLRRQSSDNTRRTRPACRVRPELPGIQRRPDSTLGLARFIAREPPRRGSPEPSTSSGKRSSSK